MKPQIGSVIQCSIRDLGHNGEGVGEYEGIAVFIEGALPGEEVSAKLTLVKKNYMKAKLQKILSPSKLRAKPSCPYFGVCGGCQIMHLQYQEQLRVKQKRVKEAFKRIAKMQDVEVLPCMPSDPEYKYRNKIQLPCSLNKQLGLFEKASHKVVPIEHCLVHLPIGEKVFDLIKNELKQTRIQPYCEKAHKGELRHIIIRSSQAKNKAIVGIVTTKKPTQEIVAFAKQIYSSSEVQGVVHVYNPQVGNRILGHKTTCLCGKDELQENLGDLTFFYSLQSFFQVNPTQAAHLYQKALEFAQISKDENVLDAYCGTGTLALFFAKQARHVWGVECVASAIDNAKKNARFNKIENATFQRGEIENYIHKFKNIDCLLLNPPRKGCTTSCLEGVIKISPKKIIYISCDPATLARDVSILNQYGYKIQKAQPFDMFAQTMHVETVALLTRP